MVERSAVEEHSHVETLSTSMITCQLKPGGRRLESGRGDNFHSLLAFQTIFHELQKIIIVSMIILIKRSIRNER